MGAALAILVAFEGGLGAPAAGAQEPGSIRGRVSQATTGTPVVGATVRVAGIDGASVAAAITGTAGLYRVPRVAPGQYVVTVESLGYHPATRSDVVVDPGRVAQADVELRVAAIALEGIRVGPGWFPMPAGEPAKGVRLNAEEVRRAPGSAGDVSRVLTSLPSTAQVADNANDLFVRGGAPFENGFYVDGIQVPNINHFPVAGSSGGPIGLLNVELIDDVTFSPGGFSAAYGDRLSSIVEIDLRDGSGEDLDGRVEVSMAGFGGGIEGPTGSSGSFYLSARRSFLDLVVDALGTGVAPRYGDLHGKVTWEPDGRNSVSALGLFGVNRISFSRQSSLEDGNPSWGENAGGQGTVGVSWRRLWGAGASTLTSVSVSGTGSSDDFYRTATGDTLLVSDRLETHLRLRTVTRSRVGERSTVQVGMDVELTRADYDDIFGAHTDRLGNHVPTVEVDHVFEDRWVGIFWSQSWTPAPRWQITGGLRADHYDTPGSVHLSPRLSTSYEIGGGWALNAAAGVHHQRLPAVLLSQDPAFRDLPVPVATHLTGGVSLLLTESTRLTVEGYGKWYDHLPLELEDPRLSVVDEGNSLAGPRSFRTLVGEGRARSHGLEALVQKKLARDLYGLVSAAWSRSRYRDLEGVWRSRISDNGYLFNVVGGYRPSHRWEMSGRFSWAGGAPYTPFDREASRRATTGIVDPTRANEARHRDYHTLNIRADRRFVFQGSALTLSFSLWNLYDRRNVAFRYWNEVENREDELLQWSFFPVVGLEWAF